MPSVLHPVAILAAALVTPPEPLPGGATARLGGTPFRHGTEIVGSDFSKVVW